MHQNIVLEEHAPAPLARYAHKFTTNIVINSFSRQMSPVRLVSLSTVSYTLFASRNFFTTRYTQGLQNHPRLQYC